MLEATCTAFLELQTENQNKREGNKNLCILLNLLARGQLILTKENSYGTNTMVTTLSVLRKGTGRGKAFSAATWGFSLWPADFVK